MTKRIYIGILVVMVALFGLPAFAQDADSLIPNEVYFINASVGEWEVVTSEEGLLTLHGLNPRQQYTITTPRLWSVSIDSAQFNLSWASLEDDFTPLEAVLSFNTYSVRLLLYAPVFDEIEMTATYRAVVLEVINFLDETRKEIPTTFTLPMLIIQPTFDFTLALMDANNNRLAGTRNADVCARLYDNYVVTDQTFRAFLLAGGRNNPAEFTRLYQERLLAYALYMETCVASGAS